MPWWKTAFLPWDLLCSPGRIAWEGDNKQQTTHGRTSRLLDRIGPVGQFGENIKIYNDIISDHGGNCCRSSKMLGGVRGNLLLLHTGRLEL